MYSLYPHLACVIRGIYSTVPRNRMGFSPWQLRRVMDYAAAATDSRQDRSLLLRYSHLEVLLPDFRIPGYSPDFRATNAIASRTCRPTAEEAAPFGTASSLTCAELAAMRACRPTRPVPVRADGPAQPAG